MRDDVLLRHIAGHATPEEVRRVEDWLAADPAHVRRHAELRAVLRLATEAEQTWMDPLPPRAADIVAATSAGPARPSRARRPLVRSGLAVAAVALMAAGAAWAWRSLQPATFGVDEFVTGPNEAVTVSLKDSSVVRLAPGSRLRITGRRGGREVSLSGRAFFAVAHQPSRPFVVRTDAGDVTVLGTRFDLDAGAEDLRLLVVEGRVAVSARGGRAEVAAGEMGRVIRGVPVPAVAAPDVDSMVTWTGDFLAFQETPLRDVAREIGREFGVAIRIHDSALRERTFTGWFSGWTLPEVMDVVCAVSHARCVTTADTVMMRMR